MANHTPLLDYRFDVGPVIHSVGRCRLDHSIAWFGLTKTLLELRRTESGAAAHYQNCRDIADTSIIHSYLSSMGAAAPL